jgi:hypothetical protein
MTVQSSDYNDLDRNLNLLISFFPQWSNWLSWSQVLFLESTSFIDNNVFKFPRSALIPTREYAERFNELLDKGYSWINMNALGVWKDSLIVVIELPSYDNNIPRGKVSINFSGPVIIDGKPQWDLSERIETL